MKGGSRVQDGRGGRMKAKGRSKVKNNVSVRLRRKCRGEGLNEVRVQITALKNAVKEDRQAARRRGPRVVGSRNDAMYATRPGALALVAKHSGTSTTQQDASKMGAGDGG